MRARVRAIGWGVILVATIVLWAAAAVVGFIGSTAFIGHVSMLALVLAAGAALEASLPSVGDDDDDRGGDP